MIALSSCSPPADADESVNAAGLAAADAAASARMTEAERTGGMESIVLGGGCFWCLEGAFEIVPGVADVVSGYAGGNRASPSYEEVSAGLTGHAEVVRVSFDPAVVPLGKLLELFFTIHDPTTEDRQGADVGTQYRSVILYDGEGQKRAAEEAIAAAARHWQKPIVTELQPLREFWLAEAYHQDFFRNNPDYGYCRIVVRPKVDKAEAFVDRNGLRETE